MFVSIYLISGMVQASSFEFFVVDQTITISCHCQSMPEIDHDILQINTMCEDHIMIVLACRPIMLDVGVR